ncbi:hypothetical protein Tco_0273404 [Tanacetum coccineum]
MLATGIRATWQPEDIEEAWEIVQESEDDTSKDTEVEPDKILIWKSHKESVLSLVLFRYEETQELRFSSYTTLQRKVTEQVKKVKFLRKFGDQFLCILRKAHISSQIQNAIDNAIPSLVDASVRSYMSGHILHVHPAKKMADEDAKDNSCNCQEMNIQYHIDQMKNSCKVDIVWGKAGKEITCLSASTKDHNISSKMVQRDPEAIALLLIIKDLLYLKKGKIQVLERSFCNLSNFTAFSLMMMILKNELPDGLISVNKEVYPYASYGC